MAEGQLGGSLSLSLDRLLDGFDCVHEDDPNQQQPVETISHHTANLNLRVPADCVGDGINQAVLGSTAVKEKGIIEEGSNLTYVLGATERLSLEYCIRAVNKAVRNKNLAGSVRKVTLEKDIPRFIYRLLRSGKIEVLQKSIPRSMSLSAYSPEALTEYGILYIQLSNSHIYNDQIVTTNEEYSRFLSLQTDVHLHDMGIAIDGFSTKAEFKRGDDGNWWTEVHLSSYEKQSLNNYIESDTMNGDFDDEMPGVVVEYTLRICNDNSCDICQEEGNNPPQEQNPDDDNLDENQENNQRGSLHSGGGNGGRPRSNISGGQNCSGPQDGDAYVDSMIEKLQLLQSETLRSRVMKKLAQSSQLPVKVLQKLHNSPYASQYIVPLNSKRLIRYALIMFSTIGRDGASEEAAVLRQALTHTGFKVITKEWSLTTELLDSIKHLLKDLLSYCSILFISIMSHGSHGVLKGTGGSQISVNHVLEVAADILPNHLPMIFLIQACQQASKNPSTEITPVVLRRPNTVLLMAALPDGVAVRGAYTGAFSDVLQNCGRAADICRIHTMAVSRMKRFDPVEQVPILFTTLNKQLLLTNREPMKIIPLKPFTVTLTGTGNAHVKKQEGSAKIYEHSMTGNDQKSSGAPSESTGPLKETRELSGQLSTLRKDDEDDQIVTVDHDLQTSDSIHSTPAIESFACNSKTVENEYQRKIDADEKDRTDAIVDLRLMLTAYSCSRSADFLELNKLTRLLTMLESERLQLLKWSSNMQTRPLLNVAACQDHTEVIKTILKPLTEHEKTELLTMSRWTPLHAAAVRGCCQSIKTILLLCSPELRTKLLSKEDKRGKTALQRAVERGREASQSALLSFEIAKDRTGQRRTMFPDTAQQRAQEETKPDSILVSWQRITLTSHQSPPTPVTFVTTGMNKFGCSSRFIRKKPGRDGSWCAVARGGDIIPQGPGLMIHGLYGSADRRYKDVTSRNASCNRRSCFPTRQQSKQQFSGRTNFASFPMMTRYIF